HGFQDRGVVKHELSCWQALSAGPECDLFAYPGRNNKRRHSDSIYFEIRIIIVWLERLRRDMIVKPSVLIVSHYQKRLGPLGSFQQGVVNHAHQVLTMPGVVTWMIIIRRTGKDCYAKVGINP